MEGDIGLIDLLPYHTLGRAKYTALGREYPWEGYDRLTDEEVQAIVEALLTLGFKVSIGGV